MSKHVLKHDFSSDIKEKIKRLYHIDNWHGCFEVTKHWFIIAFSIYISTLAFHVSDHLWTWILYFLVAIQIGGRIRSLGDIVHQASHRTLAKNRRLNDFLGKYLAGVFIFQGLLAYKHSHIEFHHKHYGDPDLDPDYRALIDQGLYGTDTGLKKTLEYIFKIPSISSTLNYLVHLIKYRIFGDGEPLRDRLERFLITVFIIVIITYFDFEKEAFFIG